VGLRERIARPRDRRSIDLKERMDNVIDAGRSHLQSWARMKAFAG
jgi:hypothetical protein